METAKKLVLFDFDGVLANTLELSYTINKDTNNHLTWERFVEISNGNFHAEFKKMIEHEGYIVPPEFFEKYEKGIENLTIHDILRDSIQELSKSYGLYIVSSVTKRAISKFLEQENIEKNFTGILGMDLHESKVVKIKSIIEQESTTPGNTVYITDTLGDILEAAECSVPSIAVTWGLHDDKTLLKGNPAKIINDPQELIPAIESVLG